MSPCLNPGCACAFSQRGAGRWGCVTEWHPSPLPGTVWRGRPVNTCDHQHRVPQKHHSVNFSLSRKRKGGRRIACAFPDTSLWLRNLEHLAVSKAAQLRQQQEAALTPGLQSQGCFCSVALPALFLLTRSRDKWGGGGSFGRSCQSTGFHLLSQALPKRETLGHLLGPWFLASAAEICQEGIPLLCWVAAHGQVSGKHSQKIRD